MLIFNIIFPIFTIAGLGYLFAKIGLFKPEHVQGLSQYVFYLAIPVLLLQTLSQMSLPPQINWPFFVAYYGGVLAIYFLGFHIQRSLFGGKRATSAVFGMSSSYSNLVLMGIPVISAAFGEEGLVAHFLIISVHSVFQFTITTVLIESDEDHDKNPIDFLRLSAGKLSKNPIILALIAGILLNLFSVQLPQVLISTLGLIRSSALPAALFMLGASLTAYKVSGQIQQASIIVFLKLFALPLVVYLLAIQIFQLPDPWGAVAVIAAALPCGVNSAVFAHKYDAAVAPVGSAVILTTLLSIGTISILLNLFI